MSPLHFATGNPPGGLAVAYLRGPELPDVIVTDVANNGVRMLYNTSQ